jgi:hypothetical protein
VGVVRCGLPHGAVPREFRWCWPASTNPCIVLFLSSHHRAVLRHNCFQCMRMGVVGIIGVYLEKKVVRVTCRMRLRISVCDSRDGDSRAERKLVNVLSKNDRSRSISDLKSKRGKVSRNTARRRYSPLKTAETFHKRFCGLTPTPE